MGRTVPKRRFLEKTSTHFTQQESLPMAEQVCLLAGHSKRGQEVEAFVAKMKPGHKVQLLREPTNRFDKNAVQVHAENPQGGERIMIGFIAKAHNRRIAALMDSDEQFNPYDAVFGYAGTGKSGVPAIKIAFPDEESAS
jgi:HIRAN domain